MHDMEVNGRFLQIHSLFDGFSCAALYLRVSAVDHCIHTLTICLCPLILSYIPLDFVLRCWAACVKVRCQMLPSVPCMCCLYGSALHRD